MTHYVYQITNLINNKKYIGKHSGELNDSYLGSGENIKNAIKKYGKENFRKDILYIAQTEEEADVKKIIGNKLNTNMFSYPITLAHYIDLIWDCGSTVGVGRGSACSALNHYLLGITQLDPIEWKFPFFRYMNRDTDGLGSLQLMLPRR